MRIYHVLALCAALFWGQSPAFAAGSQKTGLAYTTMGYKVVRQPEIQKPDRPAKPQVSAAAKPSEDLKKNNRVWEKYKRLASGTDETPPASSPAPSAPKAGGAQENPPPKANAGFAGIIQQWNESKKKRAEVRSLAIGKAPEPQ